jgi:hypothetical protein
MPKTNPCPLERAVLPPTWLIGLILTHRSARAGIHAVSREGGFEHQRSLCIERSVQIVDPTKKLTRIIIRAAGIFSRSSWGIKGLSGASN